MMDTLGSVVLCVLMCMPIFFLIYIGVWMPKDKMKGHAGRGKCKCCNN